MQDYEIEKLKASAKFGSQHSYSCYSNFAVGAACLTSTDKLFYGCNIENASYSLTLCAERVAITKAISEGETQFKAIAIYTKGDEVMPYPCGACLQVMSEFFSTNTLIIVFNDKNTQSMNIKDLLPNKFSF